MNSKQGLLLLSGIITVVILAAGVYFGLQLLNEPVEVSAASSGNGDVMVFAADDGSGPRQAQIKFENAPELPTRPAELGGVFIRREDNSLFIGTGNVSINVDVDENSNKPQVSMGHDGPIIEAVTTRDTIIYEDITASPTPDQMPSSGELVMEQEVRQVDSIEALEGNLEVTVWGSKRGDRVVADVVVFRSVRN